MKKSIRAIFITLSLLVLAFCLASCGAKEQSSDLWATALYAEDTELGNGSSTVSFTVEANGKEVEFTIHTDEKILGDALLEHNLIAGESGAYGLYVKSVNGIVADYNVNKSFWSLCSNGEPLTTGVDGVEVADGGKYEFVYTK